MSEDSSGNSSYLLLASRIFSSAASHVPSQEILGREYTTTYLSCSNTGLALKSMLWFATWSAAEGIGVPCGHVLKHPGISLHSEIHDQNSPDKVLLRVVA